MQEVHALFPKRWQILSGSALKVIAVTAMLIDHIGAVFFAENQIILFKVFSRAVTLYEVMRFVGRIAFPIYAFLLVEGFLHTRSRRNYGLNLFIFALISEIPWNLMHLGKVFFRYSQNVMVTLLLGFLGLCALEHFAGKWLPQLGSLLLLALLSLLLRCDYGITGFGFILMIYILRDYRHLQVLFGCVMLSSTWKAGLAFIPINMYNGERGFIRGRVLKYLFYAFYPCHMLILYLIRMLTVGYGF
ncbi:MAG: TraX protein [Firmicutes bacterium]|nr:TraX protein [Bacillota bacterium]